MRSSRMPPSVVSSTVYRACPGPRSEMSLATRRCTVRRASRPRRRRRPMCDTSNSPAEVRTRRCSSMMEVYMVGMRHPAKTANRAPKAICSSSRVKWRDPPSGRSCDMDVEPFGSVRVTDPPRSTVVGLPHPPHVYASDTGETAALRRAHGAGPRRSSPYAGPSLTVSSSSTRTVESVRDVTTPPEGGGRREMRKIIGHRWAIGAAALVFVFALGAISWAATTDTTSTTDGTATGPAGDPGLDGIAPGSGMLGPEGFAPGRGFSAFGRMGRLGLRGGAVTERTVSYTHLT